MRRLLIGDRGDKPGVWLTKAGRDALSRKLSDKDYLISSDSQNIGILVNGTATVSSGQTKRINFPDDVGERPLIAHAMSVDFGHGQVSWEPAYVNFDPFGLLGNTTKYNTKIFGGSSGQGHGEGRISYVKSYRDHLTIRHSWPITLSFRYLAFQQGLE